MTNIFTLFESPATFHSKIPILLIFALYTTSFGLIIPAFPVLIKLFFADNLEQASFAIGVVSLIKHALEFFATPILGTLGDIYGRKPITLFASIIVTIESSLVALFPSLYTVILSKVLAGAGDVNILMAYTIMTDILSEQKENLTHGYGLVSATFGFGFIVGPLLGSILLEHYSPPIVFLIAAIFTSTGCIVAFLLLKESNLHRKQYKEIAYKMNPFTTLCELLGDRHFAILAVPYGISCFMGGLYIVCMLHMTSILHASHMQVGYYLCIYGE